MGELESVVFKFLSGSKEKMLITYKSNDMNTAHFKNATAAPKNLSTNLIGASFIIVESTFSTIKIISFAINSIAIKLITTKI